MTGPNALEEAAAALAIRDLARAKAISNEILKGGPLMAEVMAWLSGQGFAPFDLFPVSRVPPAGGLLQIDAIFLRQGSSLWPKAPFY